MRLLCCREPGPLVAQRSPHVSIQISPSEEKVRAAWAPRAPQPSSSTLRGRWLAQQLLGRWGAPCSVSRTHVEASHCLISCTLWSARPPSWGLLVPGLRPHRSSRSEPQLQPFSNCFPCLWSVQELEDCMTVFENASYGNEPGQDTSGPAHQHNAWGLVFIVLFTKASTQKAREHSIALGPSTGSKRGINTSGDVFIKKETNHLTLQV